MDGRNVVSALLVDFLILVKTNVTQIKFLVIKIHAKYIPNIGLELEKCVIAIIAPLPLLVFDTTSKSKACKIQNLVYKYMMVICLILAIFFFKFQCG